MGNYYAFDTKNKAYDLQNWMIMIFEYCNWTKRFELMRLSKSILFSTSTESFYKILCHRLSAESGLYSPAILPTGDTWQNLFYDLYKLRNIWNITIPNTLWSQSPESSSKSSPQNNKRFKIKVYARFRPHNLDENSTSKEDCVTLPLHQRLAMIRLSHQLKSNRDALKILAAEGNWFRQKWVNVKTATIADKENMNHNLNSKDFYVVNNEKQLHLKAASVSTIEPKMISAKVQSVDSDSNRVTVIAPDVGLREFSFNGVFSESCSQSNVYDTVARRLVMNLLNGFNSTALVYGQTGSGKTYSMFGKDETSVFGPITYGTGIVPRSCHEIFSAVEERQKMNGITAQIAVSYVEVYGDQVSDLLRYGARCGHSKVAAQRYVLNGAAERVVENMQDVADALEVGEMQKRRTATAMNDRSTRAHSLFIISLKQSKVGCDTTLSSRLFLADLGGSEQVKKSQVEAGENRTGLGGEEFSLGFQLGTHMREAVNINLGLFALKKCIESLNNQAPYTPFSDSKLTMLLSDGLGGNSKTSIVICSSMDPKHVSETIATLRFGQRCALVETEARNNATMLASVLASLDSQISHLEKIILQKERWEIRQEKRFDELAEEGTFEAAAGKVEVKKVYMLVGAEIERQQLGDLLIQRARFTGESLLEEEDKLSSMRIIGEKGMKIESNETTSSISQKKSVIGFGREYAAMYGFGEKFDEDTEMNYDVERFKTMTDAQNVPLTVRAKGTTNWTTGESLIESMEDLEKKAKKIRRNKLAYAGISS